MTPSSFGTLPSTPLPKNLHSCVVFVVVGDSVMMIMPFTIIVTMSLHSVFSYLAAPILRYRGVSSAFALNICVN
jgi:hypothetical protein